MSKCKLDKEFESAGSYRVMQAKTPDAPEGNPGLAAQRTPEDHMAQIVGSVMNNLLPVDGEFEQQMRELYFQLAIHAHTSWLRAIEQGPPPSRTAPLPPRRLSALKKPDFSVRIASGAPLPDCSWNCPSTDWNEAHAAWRAAALAGEFSVDEDAARTQGSMEYRVLKDQFVQKSVMKLNAVTQGLGDPVITGELHLGSKIEGDSIRANLLVRLPGDISFKLRTRLHWCRCPQARWIVNGEDRGRGYYTQYRGTFHNARIGTRFCKFLSMDSLRQRLLTHANVEGA